MNLLLLISDKLSGLTTCGGQVRAASETSSDNTKRKKARTQLDWNQTLNGDTINDQVLGLVQMLKQLSPEERKLLLEELRKDKKISKEIQEIFIEGDDEEAAYLWLSHISWQNHLAFNKYLRVIGSSKLLRPAVIKSLLNGKAENNPVPKVSIKYYVEDNAKKLQLFEEQKMTIYDKKWDSILKQASERKDPCTKIIAISVEIEEIWYAIGLSPEYQGHWDSLSPNDLIFQVLTIDGVSINNNGKLPSKDY